MQQALLPFLLVIACVACALAGMLVRKRRPNSGGHPSCLCGQPAYIQNVHDLSTQLTTARYYLDMLLKEEYGPLRVSQVELIHQVQESVAKAGELCNAIHAPFGSGSVSAH